MEHIKNKTLIITGASQGIGEATARLFAKLGANVALIARSEEKIKKISTDINLDGGTSIAIKCDVSSPDEVKNAIKMTLKSYNAIDILIGNAGVINPIQNIADMAVSDFEKVIDVNIYGMFLCAKFAFKLMKKQKPRGGRIINNGSISAYTPRPGSAAYTTSKHAITGLTKSIALDGRNIDIVCSQIDIGNAETELTKSFKEGVIQPNGKKLKEATMDVNHEADTIINILKKTMS